MKNIKALFVLLAMIMFSGQWSMVDAREVTSLNQEWQFRKGTFGVWGVYPNIYVPKRKLSTCLILTTARTL